VDKPRRETRAREWLEHCGIGALAGRYPRELSGGELQRIAIARALVHQPRVVLADEPTGNLDARAATQILQLLREQLRTTGAGAILITHSMTAAGTADRILRLTAGRLAALSPATASQP
jgi:putative ABC transport system ATP-binding protein